MIIKELVGIESLSKGDIKYTILSLEKDNLQKGKVIFTVSKDLKIGDQFITNDNWAPIWFKDNFQNYFKLMDIKEYLDFSLHSSEKVNRDFVNAICQLRYEYISKIKQKNKRG